MARLTKEQRERLSPASGASLVEAIVECIIRLDEPDSDPNISASEDPEACVVLCRERDEARARLVEVECERKETMAKLAKVERNVAREPCEACAKKEATIEALNDWLTDTIIAHEPCEACAKKDELGATVAFVRVAKECGIAPHAAMTFVARLRRMPKKERMTLAKKLSTEVDS